MLLFSTKPFPNRALLLLQWDGRHHVVYYRSPPRLDIYGVVDCVPAKEATARLLLPPRLPAAVRQCCVVMMLG